MKQTVQNEHRKRFSLLIIAAACALMLALVGCGNSQPSSSAASESSATESTGSEELVGGWEINREVASSFFSTDMAEAEFAEAAQPYKDRYLNPVAIIGSKLCENGDFRVAYLVQTSEEDAATADWAFAFATQTPESGIAMDSLATIDPANLLTVEKFTEPDFSTDWVPDPLWTGEPAQLPEDAQAAFDKAVDAAGTKDRVPMALVATQVVAGTNYLFLVQNPPAKENGSSSFSFVTVYRDLQDNCSITADEYVDLAGYAK